MQLDKALRYVVIGGIFLLPFIPFIITNSMFFPFITGKNFLFRIIVEVIFAAWMLLAFLDTRYRPNFSWISIFLIAFVFVVAVSDLLSGNFFESFWSNFERMEGLITLLHLLMLFVVASSILTTWKWWSRLWHTSVVASIFMGLYGVGQLLGAIDIRQGGVRLDGTFGNATYLAVYMLFHLFITLVLVSKWRGNSLMYYLYGTAFVLQLVILYFTATRGAILGFLGGMLLAALLVGLFGREHMWLRRFALGTIVLIVILSGSFFALRNAQLVTDSPVLSRFSSISVGEGDVQTRFTIWGMAWEGVKEKPLLGWGQEHFNVVFNKYYDPILFAQEPWFDRVHNIVLDWLIASGFVGATLYFLVPVFVLYYIWRRDSRVHFSLAEQSLWTGLLAAYFFHNLFVFDNIGSYLFYVFLLAYIHSMVSRPPGEGSMWQREFDSGVVARIGAPLVVVALVFIMYTAHIDGYRTGTTLIQALSPQEEGLEKNIELLERAASYNSLGSQEVSEQIVSATGNFAVGASIDIQQRFFNLGLQEIEEQLERSPNDARLLLFGAIHLSRFGRFDDSRNALLKAQELSPKKQFVLFQLGALDLNNGDIIEAISWYKMAFELEPSFRDARVLYAAALVRQGNIVEADRLLKEGFNTVFITEDVLINAYAAAGLVERVREIWKFRLEKNPGDQRARLSLAATYVELGSAEEAIKEINTIIELDPNFEEQGRALIEEIRQGTIAPEPENEEVVDQ